MEPPAPDDDFGLPEHSGFAGYALDIPEASNIPTWPPEPLGSALGVPWDRSPSIAETTVNHEYRYATIGLIIGGLVVLAGVAMILLNISGAIDLTIHVKDNEVKINTAVVGIVVAFVGAAIIFFTKPRVSFAKKK
jgi:hypothetical protein